MATKTKRPKMFPDDFPAEVRNRIYATALIEDTHIDTSDAILSASRLKVLKIAPAPNDAVNATYPRLQPALLATCRQIRREAYLIYYGENTFAAEAMHYAGQFVNQLDSKVLAVMKPIHVLTPPDASLSDAMASLSLLRNSLETQFFALPVQVEGEGVVYMTEAQTQDFEEECVMVVDHDQNCIFPQYTVKRKTQS